MATAVKSYLALHLLISTKINVFMEGPINAVMAISSMAKHASSTHQHAPLELNGETQTVNL